MIDDLLVVPNLARWLSGATPVVHVIGGRLGLLFLVLSLNELCAVD